MVYFDTGVLSWDKNNKKLNIDLSEEKYEELKWYLVNYTALAKHYLDKLDAKILNLYATKQENILCQIMKRLSSF